LDRAAPQARLGEGVHERISGMGKAAAPDHASARDNACDAGQLPPTVPSTGAVHTQFRSDPAR
jgi:hypothetical protein